MSVDLEGLAAFAGEIMTAAAWRKRQIEIRKLGDCDPDLLHPRGKPKKYTISWWDSETEQWILYRSVSFKEKLKPHISALHEHGFCNVSIIHDGEDDKE